MFDANEFKRSVKDWIRENPAGKLSDLADYCEDMIPPAQFTQYQWLVDQTLDWYKHILTHRDAMAEQDYSDDMIA